MDTIEDILLLGDPLLYKTSLPVAQREVASLEPTINKLGNLVLLFREKYGRGRAIAAPQIGVLKRLIVLNIHEPVAIINPHLSFPDPEQFDLWDDCMSFPNLLVRIKRYRRCVLTFYDRQWAAHTWHLEGSMSELIQHEFDHLEGILATQRAIDNQSFHMITDLT
ncbi:MAG: peptide deformylase [Saprospiraceae bacterium]|nr:peptide deformylase [Saprospiraceae bacterium]